MLNNKSGKTPGSSEARTDTPPRRRVFTNRNLRMDSIEAIGFDMDHTIAVYNTENFNHLSFQMAIDALIRDKNYPEAIRSIVWEPEAAIRGLVVDKKFGNLLKIDGYNHVTRARHGRRFLDREQRRRRYPKPKWMREGRPVRPGASGSNLTLGTLFWRRQ